MAAPRILTKLAELDDVSAAQPLLEGVTPVWNESQKRFVFSGLASPAARKEWAYIAPSLLIDAPHINELSGAPLGGVMPWPDGSFGMFIAQVLSVDLAYVNQYTISYRPFGAPSGLADWRPVEAFAVMTDLAAAAKVVRVPEVRSENTARNAYVPSDAELAFMMANQWGRPEENIYIQYVTGHCHLENPTTDEIIQWASWKWGIPTDLLRAQAHVESQWSMNQLGDRTDISGHAGWHVLYPSESYVPNSADVYESLGFMQVRWTPDNELGPGSEPLRHLSTVFNIDYACSWIRFHLDDPGGRRSMWGDGTYVPHDFTHAQGGWFQPYPWLNAGQLDYLDRIANRMTYRPWLLADFSNVLENIKLLTQPLITRSDNGAITTRPRIVEGPYSPPAPASAPRNVIATPGNGQITLAWDAPLDQGGSFISTYLITNIEEGWTVQTAYEAQRPYTLGGLTNGQEYTFHIQAVGQLDILGAASVDVAATPNPPTVPGIPQNLAGVPHSASVTLDWDAPISDGNSPITGYQIVPYIAGVAQPPVSTGSAVPGPYTVVGLTNGTDYTFKVRAVNVIGNGADSAEAGPYTPMAAALPHPNEMPIVSRDLPYFASGDGTFDPVWAVDTNFGTQWNSFPALPTVGSPIRFSLDIRSLGVDVKANLWCLITHNTRPSWNRSGALGADGVGANKIRNYKLRAHPSVGAVEPAIDDAGWVDLVTVTDNRWSDRLHSGLDLTGYGWFQLYVTEATGSLSGGNNYASFQIQLRDASNTGANPDAIAFYGDSMVAEGLWYRVLDGTQYPVGHGPLEAILEIATGRDSPVVWMMAEGGYSVQAAVATFSGRPEYEHVIDQSDACRFLYIQLGVNDANAAAVDLNSVVPAGVNSTYAQTHKTRLQAIIDYAVLHGKIVLLPYIIASHNNAYTKPNVIILNEIIDQLVAANPGSVFLATDLFSWFDANPTAFYDNLHPSYDPNSPFIDGLSGYEHMQALIRDWLVGNLYT